MSNPMNDLGEKIFLDRYALKDIKKESLVVGDTVIVCVDQKTRQREIGKVVACGSRGSEVTVELRDGTTTSQSWDDVDKPLELTAEETMARTARGVASVEQTEDGRKHWEEKFNWLLDDWRFVPGGRILAMAGTDQQLTAYNCYVIPSPKDSRVGIVNTLCEMMEIMSRGGGVGINLSTLRPQHAYVKGVNGRSSGSVSWGGLYSFVTGLIEQGGSRRGALMLITNVWHPDILNFINSKREAGKITNANISVGITDDFMEAVDKDADWNLEFPDTSTEDYENHWVGDLAAWKAAGRETIIYKTLKAREIWNQIISSAWASAEPGVFFIDRANKESNSHYFSTLISTNPCGEQPLPAYAVCLLGAINLSRFVKDGDVNWDDLEEAVICGVRFLDNVIDMTPYFLSANEVQQKGERRIGLGIMGLAEMLIKLKLRYGSKDGNVFVEKLGKFIATNAYLASAANAEEKGSFKQFDATELLKSGFAKRLPDNVKKAIKTQGLRNVTLLTVAPTGSTGTMVGTSTGVEPYFSWSYFRTSRLGVHEERVAVADEWIRDNGETPYPDYFVTAMDLNPEDHVAAQAALQKWVDSAISKTCNVPNEYTVEQTRELYELMYKLGCKGGTIYRDGSRSEQVLNLKSEDKKDADQPKEVVKVEEAAPKHHKAKKIIKMRERPKMTNGITVEKDSPVGRLFVTLNCDSNGDPVEIFVTAGKAGSDITSVAEAIGRSLSLLLRIESEMSPMERLNEIVGQYDGIGGSNTIGLGKNQIRSMPEAIAKAIEEIVEEIVKRQSAAKETVVEVASIVASATAEAASKIETVAGKRVRRARADMCPQCGKMTLVREEGCQHCNSCGYSRC